MPAFAGLVQSAPVQAHPPPPVTVRCEVGGNPLGVDNPHPRPAWQGRGEKRGLRQPGVKFLRVEGDRAVFAVAAGTYAFASGWAGTPATP
mgnify:CR=1 FL=1